MDGNNSVNRSILEAGVELTDHEVASLPPDRQPQPFEPFALNHRAPGPGQGLKRRSMRNDRWCPFCQTVLGPRVQACATCKRVRSDFITSHPDPDRPTDTAPRITDHDLSVLIDTIDDMSRVIALNSAHQRVRGPLTKEHVEDMFGACKNVIVAAEPIRTRLRDGSR